MISTSASAATASVMATHAVLALAGSLLAEMAAATHPNNTRPL